MTRFHTIALAVLFAGAGLARAQTAPPPDDQQMHQNTDINTNTNPNPNMNTTTNPNPNSNVNVNVKSDTSTNAYGGERYGGAQLNKSETHPTAGMEETPPTETTTTTHEAYPHHVGLSILAGGGVTDFSKSDARSVTSTGGEYEARVAWNMGLIGLEGAYVGTAQNINALGLDSNAWLASNGVEGLFRLNLGTFMIQPFVFGGASYVHYSIENSSFNTSDIRSSDDTFVIPFGGGISTRLGHSGAVVDARFTYRPTFGADMIVPSGGEHQLDNWSASARLGWEF